MRSDEGRRRREVGLLARATWSALQDVFVRLRDAKTSDDPESRRSTSLACSEALAAVERLTGALRSLRAEIGDESSALSERWSLPSR